MILETTFSPAIRELGKAAIGDLDSIAETFVAFAKERKMPALSKAKLSDEQLLAIGRERIGELLDFFAGGDRDSYLRTVIARYEAGQTSGQQVLGKMGLQIKDFIQALAAQKMALLHWLGKQNLPSPRFSELSLELEALYADIASGYTGSHGTMHEENLRLTIEKETLERQVAERTRELAEQKAFAESIVEHVPAAIAYLDRDLVYRLSNPMHSSIVGLPVESIVGRPIFELFPSLKNQVEPIYRQVLDTGVPFHATNMKVSFPRAGRDDSSYWDISYVPVFDQSHAIKGVLVLAIEATERVTREASQRETIKALRRADELKDQFLSILSHELRTPINAITGFGSILEDEVVGPLNEDQLAFVKRMLGGADILLNLVNDLLDMSRIQAGKFSLFPESTDLGPVIREVLSTLSPLAGAREITLEPVLEGDLRLVGDPRRLAQVLTNLVTNAIKFSPNGSPIIARSHREPDAIRTEVVDQGPGIPAEERDRLFQPFTQLDMSSTRPVGGTGLGLSIAKALVEAHGGQIGVKSSPSGGSIFWFSLPLSE